MGDTIQVNFSKPMPLFPLSEVVLLPHALQPLRVFEPRYVQMLKHALDGPGQFAMASLAEDGDESVPGTDVPALRPAVCVGQIVQHHRHREDLHDVVLLGICRARIAEVDEPDATRLYREAQLRPVDIHGDEVDLSDERDELREIMSGTRLSRLSTVNKITGLFERSDVPTHALLELIGFELLEDPDVKYDLLAEPDPRRRVELIKRELFSLDELIARADRQPYRLWPKGMSWN